MKHLFSFFVFAFAALFSQTAVGSDFATTMMESTFKLFHQSSTATCFLIRDGKGDAQKIYIVTSAHVFEQMKGETAIIVLRRKEEDGSYKRVDHKIQIRDGETIRWTKHKKHDVAIMELNGDLPVPVSALPINSLIATDEALKDAGVRLCGDLFLFTYPQRFEANAGGFPVARKAIFASPPQLPSKSHPTFLADYKTFAGDSGGPVFIEGKAGNPLIVGVVLGQNHHDEKTKTELTEQTVKHPLNMGIILHARYILETIGEIDGESSEVAK